MIGIKLSLSKFLDLDSMVKTSFYAPDGKPMSAEEFIRKLFAEIPNFFQSKEELRCIWLKDLLELKYKSLSDAKMVMGDVKSIREIFIGFQKYLYEDEVTNNYELLGMVAEPRVKYGDL